MELISREEAIKMLKACSLDQTKFNYYRLHLEAVPTVEAKEIVHGEWKYYRKKGIAVCKNCSFERKLDDDFGRAIACPNCGCRMEK